MLPQSKYLQQLLRTQVENQRQIAIVNHLPCDVDDLRDALLVINPSELEPRTQQRACDWQFFEASYFGLFRKLHHVDDWPGVREEGAGGIAVATVMMSCRTEICVWQASNVKAAEQ